MRENEIYLDSWEAKSKALSAAWNEFVNTFLNADIFKGFIDGAQKFLSFLTDINGMIPIVAGLISGLLASAILKGTFTLEGFNAALIKTNILSGGIPMLIGAIVTLVGVGVSWGATAFDTSKQIEKLTDKIEEQQTEIDKLTAKEKDVVDLYEEYNSLMTKSEAYGLNAEEKENLLKISNELVNTYGLEVQGIDAVTGAYIVGANAINGYVEALRAERLEKEKEQTKARNQRIDKNIDIIKSKQPYIDAYETISDGAFDDIVKKYKEVLAGENLGADNIASINAAFASEIENRAYQLNIPPHIISTIQNHLMSVKDISDEIHTYTTEISSATNSIIKDIFTNIKVDNADLLNSDSESFMTQLLTPYLSSDSINWDEFDREDFEKKVSEFINGNKETIDTLIGDIANTNESIYSKDVSIDDYKKYIKNETTRASMLSAITGSEEAGQQIIDNLANNFGAKMAEISNKLGDSSDLFDTFTTNFLRLEREFVQGEISFDEYIDSINSSLNDLDMEKTFGANTNEMKSFFSSMQDKGKSVLENIAADFKAGKKSLTDYLSEVESVGEYFVNLGNKAALSMGSDSDTAKSIQSTTDQLSTLLAELKELQGVVEETSVSFEDFQKKPLSSVEALVNKLLDLGFTVEELGGDATDSAKDIAQSLKTETDAFSKMQTSLALKTQSVLAQIGGSIGKIISGITDYVKNFSVKFEWFNEGGKFGFKPVISGDSSASSGDRAKFALISAGAYRDDITFGELTPEQRAKYLDVLNNASDEEIYFGNLLSESIDTDFLNSLIGKDFSGGGVVGGDVADGVSNDSGANKTAFDDNYYSLVNALIEENKKEIERLEKEQEDLNRQFENALETGNKERAEILRTKLAENARAQKDALHRQNNALRITKQDLLESLYQVAPELDGKSWEEISEVDLVGIENRLNKMVEETETSKNNNDKDKAKLQLNTFKGIVEDLKEVDSIIKENSASWWDIDENAKNYWASQIDFQEEYSRNWIENQKAFDKMTDEEELAAYGRMINNNKEFQKQILNDTSLTEEAKLELIKNTNDKILDIEKDAYDKRKDVFDKANDLANAYFDSQKTLLNSHYDVENSIAEAQHEINKELETSKTMYEWLDEDTRKLLFNQEDYNALSEELYDIQYKAEKLQRQYQYDLENATLDTIESITSEYEMQYETLMKSYEIAKADLEIAKKKAQLNNVLNERNVRMFINGQWQWVANTEDVINAKAELADAEYAKQVEEAGLTQQQSINNLTKQQDELGVVIKKFESGVISLDDAVRLASEAIGNLPSALSPMYSSASPSFEATKSYGGIKSYGGTYYTSNSDYMNSIRHATSEAEVISLNASRNAKIAGDGRGEDTMTDVEAIAEWKKAKGHASGTRFTPGGLTKMGEDGEELFISANGRLIPIAQPTIGNIASGGVVFNKEQMKNLRTMWDMSNFNFGGNSALVGKLQPQQIDQSQDNRIIINGMTVDSGSADGQALISALRRYVGNH